MTSIASIRSFQIDIPPSCIAFCGRDFLVIGTYLLEREPATGGDQSQDGQATSDEGSFANTPVAAELQRRSGCLMLYRIDEERNVIRVQTIATPYAILDLEFSPHSPQTLCVATSTGSLALFHLALPAPSRQNEVDTDGPAAQILPLAVHQFFDRSVLVLDLEWHPQDHGCVGVTLSTGEVTLCHFPDPGSAASTPKAGIESSGSGDGSNDTVASISTTPIHSHDLEAWTLAFAVSDPSFPSADSDDSDKDVRGVRPSSIAIYSGGDDATLRFCSDSSGPVATQGWSDRRVHGAGVTAVLPLSNVLPRLASVRDVLLTGSYDDHIRVLYAPALGRRQVLAECGLGGGVWRLQVIEAGVDDGGARCRVVVLASCMHAGARVVEIVRSGSNNSSDGGTEDEDREWSINVLAKFEEHESMNYGGAVRPFGPGEGANREREVVSTSFYDKRVCLWKTEIG